MSNSKSFLKKFSWNIKTIAILMIIIAVLIGIFGTLYYKNSLSAVTSKDEPIYFAIVEGDNVTTVTERLEKQKIIKNASMAKISAKFNGVDDFTVGTYIINRKWDTPKILKYLSNAKNINNDEVLITFKEGIWAKDIAKKIEEETDVSADELIALWNDETFLKACIEQYDFLDEAILNEKYRVKLEGYLYPETYYFKRKTTPEEVTYTFLNQFAVEYENIRSSVEKSKLSLHEIITLASIVQYESATKEDMEKVAGVFYNRLAIDQKLESSVTVCYSLYEFDNWLECEQKAHTTDSPYNTYLYSGLPIGPILNPGKQAIEAVLHPAEHDYLYFIADVQGDNTVYYAKTYEEHTKNVEKYLDY
ncbi:UPF0755 protein [Breznakia sp. PF5-3]|uniref:endolytic transglycosylase MltG n=1 Tax=unclassified Breznakia TaxID=2623764 RepID=UPI0024067BCD|nr:MULTISPECIES: endolytic transglycosylase MltG [unclassified Breznakia]MDF9825325.1 UPF0755 protein [Breznakia sp. PM6-1]MDF9836180.1 UPF0755 protein [Breznakia sp. PF5-3]MDF9838422.1 UPF0755 protein [Breznakia sp. PFB2-8]MDF9860438.1 UPF0755 protein [Breznakia sp. PH5-24]